MPPQETIRRALGRLWGVPWRNVRVRVVDRPRFAAFARYDVRVWYPGRG